MTPPPLTRRQFLYVGGMVATAAAVSAAPKRVSAAKSAPITIYRFSLRGRRGSKAGKLHAANFRFATMEAADQHRAHPGDNSRIVPIVVSADEYDRLFGARDTLVADLRRLGGPARVGDCDRNGFVVIDELIRGVNIALGNAPVSECTPFDRSGDGRVTVDELVRGVKNALD